MRLLSNCVHTRSAVRWGFPPQGPPQGILALENQRLQEEAERYWEGVFLQEWFQWSMVIKRLVHSDGVEGRVPC